MIEDNNQLIIYIHCPFSFGLILLTRCVDEGLPPAPAGGMPETFDILSLWQCRAILADDGSGLTVQTQNLDNCIQ